MRCFLAIRHEDGGYSTEEVDVDSSDEVADFDGSRYHRFALAYDSAGTLVACVYARQEPDRWLLESLRKHLDSPPGFPATRPGARSERPRRPGGS